MSLPIRLLSNLVDDEREAYERDVWERLQAGHVCEWHWKGDDGKTYWTIGQYRGTRMEDGEAKRVLVQVVEDSLERARQSWKLLLARGFIYDKKTKRRIEVPGAR